MATRTGFTISIQNVGISRPKGIRHNAGNLGSPKGSNPYGDRVRVVWVTMPRRLTVGSLLNRREYSTGSRNSVVPELKSLTERVRKCPLSVVDRKLYGLICNPYFLEIAYNNIRSNPGNMTAGVVPETLDGMS